MKHLILYDGPCPFCNRFITFLLKHDHKSLFYFAPLQGSTAKSFESTFTIDEGKSVIFIKNYQTKRQEVSYRSRAVFNVLWQLGGFWKIFGGFSFLPSFALVPCDWMYNIIARNRSSLIRDFKDNKGLMKKAKEKFLP